MPARTVGLASSLAGSLCSRAHALVRLTNSFLHSVPWGCKSVTVEHNKRLLVDRGPFHDPDLCWESFSVCKHFAAKNTANANSGRQTDGSNPCSPLTTADSRVSEEESRGGLNLKPSPPLSLPPSFASREGALTET